MPDFSPITPNHLAHFREILSPEFVRTDAEMLEKFSSDYTEDLNFPPEVVLRPGNTQEVAKIMKYCHENRIPVTPAGGRTGLSGGMLAVHGGVILAMERFDQVLNIDEANLQATVQPGVVTEAFQNAVAEKGLFYPVDPASKGSCFIGGNLAECSGGIRAVKYGITKDYVLDLEVVLPNGEIIHTGAKTLKNSTGYNLTQLMVGSEGTLGIITEATFRLLAMPTHRTLLLAPFSSAERACEAVATLFKTGLQPSVVEFMEKEAIDFAQEFLGEFPFDTTGLEAHLMVELDGNDPEQLMKESEVVFEVFENHGSGEVLFAESPEEQARLWKVRRTIGEATRAGRVVKEEDTVVPRAALAELWKHIKATANEYDLQAFCFGHAGDGNLHVHILRPTDEKEKAAWEQRAEPAIRKIFQKTVDLGGTLSGEHGIGWVQKNYMDIAFSPVELALMKGIKDVFDPNGILNPGKVFPEG